MAVIKHHNNLVALQEQWKTLYQHSLPAAAMAKSPAQSRWPVHNDHCFARIILDSTVGCGRTPWTAKVKTPAYKNMSQEQLQQSVELGEKILKGEVDLVELDRKSLEVRGKGGKEVPGGTLSKYFTAPTTAGKKRTRDDDEEAEAVPELEKSTLARSPKLLKPAVTFADDTKTPSSLHNTQDALTPANLSLIRSSPHLTPFRKSVLTALCQVPHGQYTTYGTLSAYLHSSPRAVGNALRNNPFAPGVPCHRVLATGGGLGGFKGSWGKGGKEGVNDGEKLGLLTTEGVRFDPMGRVVGGVWDGFV